MTGPAVDVPDGMEHVGWAVITARSAPALFQEHGRAEKFATGVRGFVEPVFMRKPGEADAQRAG